MKNYTAYHQQELKKAIAYLRERRIYVADYGNKFVPTNAATTDVAATIARYRQQTQGVNLIRRAK
ncbi:MAG: hypothetical protein EB015_21260 [Methylocystaceae bacterium]|nr:hypothetical protein [Methylocystaceae bacterium]